MFQLIISHMVNGHFGAATFRTGHFRSRMYSCGGLGLWSVRYNFGGLGQFGIVLGGRVS